MTFGEKLQKLRAREGFSQDALAELLDVSRQAVSKWQRDEAMPEAEKLVRISDQFSVTIDSLLRSDREIAAPAPPDRPPRSCRLWEAGTPGGAGFWAFWCVVGRMAATESQRQMGQCVPVGPGGTDAHGPRYFMAAVCQSGQSGRGGGTTAGGHPLDAAGPPERRRPALVPRRMARTMPRR